MRIGILTGGGDCPGLNAAIRAVVRHGNDEIGASVWGFRDGWRGVMEGVADELTRDDVGGILPRGGTILGTSGTQPSAHRMGSSASGKRSMSISSTGSSRSEARER